MNPLLAAHAAAVVSVHQLLVAALQQPEDSAKRLDCAGAAEDFLLTLETYAHLFGPVIATPS